MADPIWRTKMQKLLDRDKIGHSGVFGVTDNESELNIHKFKMADPIWLNKLSPEILWFDAFLSRKRYIKFWNFAIQMGNIYNVIYFRKLDSLLNHLISLFVEYN